MCTPEYPPAARRTCQWPVSTDFSPDHGASARPKAGKRQPSVRVLHEIAVTLEVPMHLLTLLASRPEDLNAQADPKQVAELAGALLRLLVRVGEQKTLPLAGSKKKRKKKTA